MTKTTRRTKKHQRETDDGLWMNISGRTFLLKSPRDVTIAEMSELGIPTDQAHQYVAGIPPGLQGFAVYDRKYVRSPTHPIPRISHTRLWNLGRSYAKFAAPHIISQARATNYPLPVRSVQELFPVVKDIYPMLERDHGLSWDHLLASQQDDFLTGFWNQLREDHIVGPSTSGIR